VQTQALVVVEVVVAGVEQWVVLAPAALVWLFLNGHTVMLQIKCLFLQTQDNLECPMVLQQLIIC
jgi:hypothetical protein